MKRTGRKKEWSIVLFCGSILVLLPPVITLFDHPDFIFGLPIAYISVFGFWALVIVAIAYGARRGTMANSYKAGIEDAPSDIEQGKS